MQIKLPCEYAKHNSRMQVICRKQGGTYCGHQYYKSCKGWWALSDTAAGCPLRKERKQ